MTAGVQTAGLHLETVDGADISECEYEQYAELSTSREMRDFEAAAELSVPDQGPEPIEQSWESFRTPLRSGKREVSQNNRYFVACSGLG